MRIAIRDTGSPPGAIGGARILVVYLAEALSRLAEIDVYTNQPELFPSYRTVECDSPYHSSRTRWALSLIMKSVWPDELIREYDCVLNPSQTEPLVKAGRAKSVVVVHDLVPLLFPRLFPRSYLYYRFLLKRSLLQVDRVIAVSENTRNDLLQHYGFSKEQVAVIRPAFNPQLIPSGNGSAGAGVPCWQRFGRYILYVGSQMPHKNLARLIEAFSRLRMRHDINLVMAGPVDPRYLPAYESTAERCGVRKNVHILGRVPHNELAAVLGHARALVLPSLYEGFGMTPLEAMAAGVPAAVSRTSSIPETCGEAAVYFDPCDTPDMTRALETVLCDEQARHECIQRGSAQARTFSWDSTAREFCRVVARL